MRNAKRFLSLVVAALLSVSAIATSASAAKFTDVDVTNEALNDAVELLTALNVTKGTTETTFGTDENVTRQQMAAFIYRMMKAGKSVEGGTNTTSFTDLDDATFYFMVSWANSQGIIKGRTATTFDPKGGITLQDAYTMIVRALGYDDGTLAYPIGYISLAEDLGLDEDLPSTLNYTDTLTRGNVAIILANMFYAETAEVEVKYEAGYKWVYPDYDADGNGIGDPQVVSTGQVPKEYHKTVAEAIFEVEKISQRVIATPSYSFNGAEKPDEDVEMLTLTKDGVADYEDYDTEIDSLGQVEFSDLGLEGKADDYFLSDIVMFVKEVDGEYEVFGATAQGTKTTVSFEDVEFGTVTGTNASKYYDGTEKEYKIINGKVTLDGTVTYLFDAPYSFVKDDNATKYNAKFITLDTFDGDMEEGDVFVNYKSVNDVVMDETIVGWDYDEENDVWEKNYSAYLAQVYYGGLGEIDVYDCDGNGKPDYLFVKNYVVGTIDTTEDEDVQDADELDLNADELVIYTDKSIVEGVEFADDDVVLAYVNAEANYVKVAEVLAGVEAEITTQSDDYIALSTGEKVFYQDAQVAVVNGAATLKSIIDSENTVIDFDASNDATYYFTANGKLVYVTGLATALNLDADWVVVLKETTDSASQLVDGKLEVAEYVTIYHDGEVKSVKAKAVAETSTVYDVVTTPVVDLDAEKPYADYLNKLATGKSDKKGAYYFELLDTSINNEYTYTDEETDEDVTPLADKEDESTELRVTGADKVNFYQYSGNIYKLSDASTASSSKIKGVYVRPYTKIIIRSVDKDGEDVLSLYTADNLPDIKEETEFNEVTYVLVNNVNSTSYENLAVFYGVVGGDGQLKGEPGEVAEVRVVKSFTRTASEDGTIYTYDVYNPFTGKVDAGIEGVNEDATSGFAAGSIVALTTTGLIDDEIGSAGNAFTAGVVYDTYYDFEDYTDESDSIGYVEVTEYDETTGYLEIGDDKIYEITADTVVTFADKSEQTIKTVDADVLGSTSKTYRQDEDKNNALRVVLCVEENEDAEEEGLFYTVTFAMIVRD